MVISHANVVSLNYYVGMSECLPDLFYAKTHFSIIQNAVLER